LLMGVAGLWAVRIPLAYLWSGWLNSPTGIWNAFIVAGIAELLISVVYYRYANWEIPVIDKEKLTEEVISSEIEREDGTFRT
nr:hypothetical protein [Elusimicrobiota bacterium]